MSVSRRWATLLAALCFWTLPSLLSSSACFAAVQRFAVVVGNNLGDGADAQLRYAESDAAKVARVLRDLGGFAPANIVLLQNEDSPTVRRTVISLNARIRARQSQNQQTLLFVFYSGHADATSLRLGSSRLPFQELAELVRGSSATFRLLVVDACRSGTLTRVKGGSIGAPFDIATDTRLSGEGLAFLTASSANEDAQESDEIRGSFFTHALVSGLLGAADIDRDGAVVLEEAYRYARDATVRTTSRTFAGTQHPTFQYDVRGQDSLVLTRPGANQSKRGQLVFPQGVNFLVMSNDEHGAVVGEVGAGDRSRALSVRAGRYFVRGRGDDYLLEGSVDAGGGESRAIAADDLNKVEYARLVRKGLGVAEAAHGFEMGASGRSQLPNATSPCLGLSLGYLLSLPALNLGTRVSACTSSLEGRSELRGTTREVQWTLRAEHVWDLNRLGLFVDAELGATLTQQSFETLGVAPDRVAITPVGSFGGGVRYALTAGMLLGLEGGAEAHLIDFQARATTSPQLRTAFAARGQLSIIKQF